MVEIQEKKNVNIKTSTKIKILLYLHIYNFLIMPKLTHVLFHSSLPFFLDFLEKLCISTNLIGQL
jgi:hypothetical protein